MHRRICAVVACSLLLAMPALGASDRDHNDCMHASGEQKIVGCTRTINDAKESPHNRAIAYKIRCGAYSDNGDNDRAIADCGEAIRIDPKFAAAYNNRCGAYSDNGDNDRAIADCIEAIQLNPKDAKTYYNRANAYLRKGDLDKATVDYNEAIRLDPKFSWPHGNLAMVHFIQTDYVSAINDYSAAIQLDPKAELNYRGRGIVSLYAGALPKALADINQASAIDPKNGRAALWLEIVNNRSNLPNRLADMTSQIDMTKWPAAIIRLYLGQMTAQAVLAAADDPSSYKQKQQVCEANLFIGELALQQARKDVAITSFRTAAETCPKEEWGSSVSRIELKALGAQP